MSVDTEDYTIRAVELIGQYLEEKLITRGNPCDNTGSEYENQTFLISAYDWRDEIPEDEAVPNFWYKPLNLQIEWYKHIGRGTYSNRPVSIDEVMSMLNDCIASLQDAAIIIETADQDFFWEVEEPDEG